MVLVVLTSDGHNDDDQMTTKMKIFYDDADADDDDKDDDDEAKDDHDGDDDVNFNDNDVGD